MSLAQFGAAGANLIVFGIPIDEYGETDPPVQIEDIDPRGTLKRGIGRTAVRLDPLTTGKRLTLYLMPGSVQARQIMAAYKSGIDASFTFHQNGSNEYFAGYDGILVSRGPATRAGKTTVSDEQFVFEFADSEET